MIARLGVAALAVVVIGWLGMMERDARLYARGIGAAQHAREDARSFTRAEADLRGARFLNPDRAADLTRAFLYQGSGRAGQAVALLEEVLRSEPDNLPAWGLLYAFTRDRDAAAARRARAALRRLDPLRASRRRA